MKISALLSFCLLATLLVASAVEEVKATTNQDCVDACYAGRAAFVAWCRTMGPGHPCLKLATSPPFVFNPTVCLPYCNSK